MEVSLDLLLEAIYQVEWLQAAGPRVTVNNQDAKICRIALLASIGEAMPEDTLWCGYLSNILALGECLRGKHTFVGFGSEQEFRALMRQKDCNCIYFPIHVNMASVFNEILSTFARLSKWENDLKLSTAAQEPLQNIVDICDSIMTNPIIIWNASFEILAYSRKHPFKRQQIQHALDEGRFSGEDIERFIRMKYFHDPKRYDKISLVYPPNWMECPFAIRVIAEGENTVLSFAQYFVDSTPSVGQVEMLHVLEESIQKYVNENMKTGRREKRLLNETFLIDLINGTIDSKEIITDRVKILNIPYKANYKLYCISFEKYSPTLAYHTKNNCKSLFPYSTIVLRGQQVIILQRDYSDRKRSETRENSYDMLKNLLEICDANCGISNPFTNLSFVHSGFLQASAALRSRKYMDDGDRITLFSDALLADMFEQYVLQSGIDPHFICNPKLDLVIKNDEATKNDNLHMLDILLNNNRNITQTAKEMNLHRNSVIYRLERIEQLMGASLDDSKLRFQLSMSLKMLKFIEKMPKKDLEDSQG